MGRPPAVRCRHPCLIFWLTAYLAVARRPASHVDPLQDDLARLREAMSTTEQALVRFPGLAGRYRQLCAALLAVRPVRRNLPPMEEALEAALRALLGDDAPLEGWSASMAAAVADPGIPTTARPTAPSRPAKASARQSAATRSSPSATIHWSPTVSRRCSPGLRW